MINRVQFDAFYSAMLYVSAVFAVSRCLSGLENVTFMYCIQTAENIFKLLSRPDSPFLSKASASNSNGVQNTRGGKNLRLFISEIVRDKPMVAMDS